MKVILFNGSRYGSRSRTQLGRKNRPWKNCSCRLRTRRGREAASPSWRTCSRQRLRSRRAASRGKSTAGLMPSSSPLQRARTGGLNGRGGSRYERSVTKRGRSSAWQTWQCYHPYSTNVTWCNKTREFAGMTAIRIDCHAFLEKITACFFNSAVCRFFHAYMIQNKHDLFGA